MIVIGLTGSIGTGKSTATKQFARFGALTLNSDTVVHELLAPGGEAVAEVAALFPATLEWGRINHQLLGAEVFGNAEKRKALEAIIHPLVRKRQDGFLCKARLKGARLAVLDIPLLFETGGEKRCDATVVTLAPAFIQKRRVFARPNMNERKFRHILAAQMPDAQKKKRADFIVRTGLGKAHSLKEVKKILLRLLAKDGSFRP